MKYTAEDFRNARFATHPDGRFAARVDQGDTVLNWVVNEHSGYGWRTDQEMADEEWKPVSAGRRITESEARERLANEGIAFAVIFNQALRWAGVKIHPDPEPTNAEKLAHYVRQMDLTPMSPNECGKWLDEQGVKAPGGDES